MKHSLLYAALVVVIGAASSSTLAAQKTAPASTLPKPTLAVACEGIGPAATLRITLGNPGTRDTAVRVGFVMDRGKTQVVDAIYVITLRALTGSQEDFAYISPHGAVTGAVEPWVVTIKAGGTSELSLKVGSFLSRLNYQNFLSPDALSNAHLAIDAQPIKASPGKVWVGQLDTPTAACQ